MDERLSWIPAQHNNMTEIVVEARKLWKPELAVINGYFDVLPRSAPDRKWAGINRSVFTKSFPFPFPDYCRVCFSVHAWSLNASFPSSNRRRSAQILTHFVLISPYSSGRIYPGGRRGEILPKIWKGWDTDNILLPHSFLFVMWICVWYRHGRTIVFSPSSNNAANN